MRAVTREGRNAMSQKTIVVLLVALFGFVFSMGCGPNCAVVLSKKTPDAMARDDVERVNAYVEARKAAIAEAKNGKMNIVNKIVYDTIIKGIAGI